MPIYLQDVVTYFPQKSSLSHLKPYIHLAEPPELSEVADEVNQPKLHHQICNLLAARVLGLANVGVEVPCHDEVLVPESCQGLL